MAKDWKKVAADQKQVIAELKAMVREHEAWDKRQQKEYARLEKVALFWFQEMKRMRAGIGGRVDWYLRRWRRPRCRAGGRASTP